MWRRNTSLKRKRPIPSPRKPITILHWRSTKPETTRAQRSTSSALRRLERTTWRSSSRKSSRNISRCNEGSGGRSGSFGRPPAESGIQEFLEEVFIRIAGAFRGVGKIFVARDLGIRIGFKHVETSL